MIFSFGAASSPTLLESTEPIDVEDIEAYYGTAVYDRKVTVRKGKGDWPCLIRPKMAYDPFLVRADILEEMLSAGITGIETANVSMKVKSKLPVNSPEYFSFFSTSEKPGQGDLYEKVMENRFVKIGSWDLGDNESRERLRANAKSVDSRKTGIGRPKSGAIAMNEVATLKERRHFGEYFCGSGLLDLVINKGWAGFCFYPADALGLCDDDVHQLSWPPSTWYPKSQVLDSAAS